MTVEILGENALIPPLMFFDIIHSLFPVYFPEKKKIIESWKEVE